MASKESLYKGLWVLGQVLIIIREDAPQVIKLLLTQGFNYISAVFREEEKAACLTGAHLLIKRPHVWHQQWTQDLMSSEALNIAFGVDPMHLSYFTKHIRSVVLESRYLVFIVLPLSELQVDKVMFALEFVVSLLDVLLRVVFYGLYSLLNP